MQTVRELLPGIWTWSQFDEERQIDFNGFYVTNHGESVIVDPPPLEEPALERLRKQIGKNDLAPLKAILLTNVHHERASANFKILFSVPVYVHELDAGGLETPADGTFRDGQTVFGGLKVIHLPDQKSPGESAFWIAEWKVLVVGDALIGRVPGKVNLLPEEKYPNPDRAHAGLQRLVNVEFDTLLVGDGHSILTGAQKVVTEFLSK